MRTNRQSLPTDPGSHSALRPGASVAGFTSKARKLAARSHDLSKAALAVWNNQAHADEWMNTRLYELGDKTPIEACATDAGLEEAKKILLRITYGAPA